MFKYSINDDKSSGYANVINNTKAAYFYTTFNNMHVN